MTSSHRRRPTRFTWTARYRRVGDPGDPLRPPDTTPVPRVFFTERAGPIPLSSLEAVAGTIDPQTAAPEPGAPLPHQVFEEAPGVQPNPPLYGPPLAEEIYGPKAIPADTETQGARPVGKEAAGDGGAGITAGTGLFSYDLEGRSDDEEAGRGRAGGQGACRVPPL